MSLRRSSLAALALVALVALGLVGAGPAAAGGCAFSNARAGAVTEPALRHATLCLVNRERARRGLRRLRQDRRLMKAGRLHTRDMVRKRYFAHTSKSGVSFSERIFRSGYFRGARRWAAGENIAWGARKGSTPSRIVRAWLDSPGHRRNMLSRRWREVGIGIVRGTPRGYLDDGAIYATEFAVRD
jgi:uncharacterized protein YkwD